ncbi:hypothetical protein JQN58_20755 [Aneurinibacillus sp. BA2021]|nr:hypothetical protein [Aneurinibacillus sp. BA2021]
MKKVDIKKGTSVLSSYSYALDANGRIQNITDQTGAVINSYIYDDAGQLKSYTDRTGTTEYEYDNVGNRKTKTAPNGTTTYQYNNLNQLTARFGADGEATYQYNDKGELTSKDATRFDWNTDGKITKVTRPDYSTVEFKYDAQGRRTEKIVKNPAGTITRHLQYEYEDATGNLLVETDILAGSKIVYSYSANGGLISQTQNGKTYYYNYDGQGNVVSLTDAAGSIVVSYTYDPWGEKVTKTGTIYNPFTYRGYYQDIETGLYYLLNRYYDPEDGRFLSRDTVEPLNANLYIYVANDPINLADPDGTTAKARYIPKLEINIDFRGFGKAIRYGGAAGVFTYILFGNPTPAGGDAPNWELINENYLKKKGIDAHDLKRASLGKKAKIAQYDLYVDKNTKEIYIFKKGRKGTPIRTGEYL